MEGTIPRSEVISLLAALLGVNQRVVLSAVKSVAIGPYAVTVDWSGTRGLTSVILIGDD